MTKGTDVPPLNEARVCFRPAILCLRCSGGATSFLTLLETVFSAFRCDPFRVVRISNWHPDAMPVLSR